MSSGRCGKHMTPLQVVPGQSEQPTYCPDCKVEALERDLAEARECTRQLGLAHIDVSNHLDAMRERHAVEVEQAFRCGFNAGEAFSVGMEMGEPCAGEDAAWSRYQQEKKA